MPFSRSRSPESMTRSTSGLVGAERAGLAEHRVDEGGLAVVDVGDDGDVAQVVAGAGDGHGGTGDGEMIGHGTGAVSHTGGTDALIRDRAALLASRR